MKQRLGLVILMLSLAIPGALASERLEISLGYSQVIGPVENMSTVIVGDDGVADATLGGGGTIILTGKSLGATNLIVLDESGRELLASPLHVVPLDRRPTTSVRVVRGVAKAQDYVCGADDGCMPVAGNEAPPNAPMVVINGTGNGTTIETPDSPEASDPASQDQLSLNP